MIIEIKHKVTNNVLYACEAENLKEAVETAAKDGARLDGARLVGARLDGARLYSFKNDFFNILLRAPNEIAGLRQHLLDGKVDGTCYEGECSCLLGTISNVRGCNYKDLGNGINPDSTRPAEEWFKLIRKGSTPENSNLSKLTVEWLDEFVSLLEGAKNAN